MSTLVDRINLTAYRLEKLAERLRTLAATVAEIERKSHGRN